MQQKYDINTITNRQGYIVKYVTKLYVRTYLYFEEGGHHLHLHHPPGLSIPGPGMQKLLHECMSSAHYFNL